MWCELWFLIDVIRERLEFPALLNKVVGVYNKWQYTADRRPEVVVEDAGSGTALVQYLRADYNIYAHTMKANADKVVRMSTQSPKIERGEVFLPRGAKWLNEFRIEVLAFPHGKHDDQVDSMSQALKYLANARALVAVSASEIWDASSARRAC